MKTAELSHYDAARKALAAARSTDEVKKIRDVAAAMKLYAQQSQDKDLELDAAEIRFRAERRLGELIIEQKNTVGLQAGARGIGKAKSGVPEKYPTIPTLADAGITKKLSSHAQKLAAIPEKTFEVQVRDWRDRESAASRNGFLKPQKKSIPQLDDEDAVSKSLGPARKLATLWASEQKSLRFFIHETRQFLKYLERVEELRDGKVSA